MGGPKNIPSGKENMLNNMCSFQNISNGKENTPTNTCDLSGLHEVTIQVESRGSWKRVLRDKVLSKETIECSQLSGVNQIKKLSEVKRSGVLSDGDSNYSGWQKKVRGDEGNQTTTLDGDEAEVVVQPRCTQ
ncbi:hypothetical protein FCV25MIE_15310 [Fagus crenata]